MTTHEWGSALLAKYEGQPVARALLQLLNVGGIPAGSAIDAAISGILVRMRTDRIEIFLDELSRDGTAITQALCSNEDFLHLLATACRCALQTRREEKIRLFARILKDYANKIPDGVIPGAYEEHTRVLDDLSVRELEILRILWKYEGRNPGKNAVASTKVYWADFEAEVAKRLSIPVGEVRGLLSRMTRTGFYEIIVGTYLGYEGGRGYLTPNFHRFKDVLGLVADTA